MTSPASQGLDHAARIDLLTVIRDCLMDGNPDVDGAITLDPILSDSLSFQRPEHLRLTYRGHDSFLRFTTESQWSISDWAEATFGEPGTSERVAIRALEELVECLRAISTGQADAKVVEEVADTVIVLCRLVTRCGGDLYRAIDEKMAVNRAREWNLDGSGHGYHVRHKGIA